MSLQKNGLKNEIGVNGNSVHCAAIDGLIRYWWVVWSQGQSASKTSALMGGSWSAVYQLSIKEGRATRSLALLMQVRSKARPVWSDSEDRLPQEANAGSERKAEEIVVNSSLWHIGPKGKICFRNSLRFWLSRHFHQITIEHLRDVPYKRVWTVEAPHYSLQVLNDLPLASWCQMLTPSGRLNGSGRNTLLGGHNSMPYLGECKHPHW